MLLICFISRTRLSENKLVCPSARWQPSRRQRQTPSAWRQEAWRTLRPPSGKFCTSQGVLSHWGKTMRYSARALNQGCRFLKNAKISTKPFNIFNLLPFIFCFLFFTDIIPCFHGRISFILLSGHSEVFNSQYTNNCVFHFTLL